MKTLLSDTKFNESTADKIPFIFPKTSLFQRIFHLIRIDGEIVSDIFYRNNAAIPGTVCGGGILRNRCDSYLEDVFPVIKIHEILAIHKTRSFRFFAQSAEPSSATWTLVHGAEMACYRTAALNR